MISKLIFFTSITFLVPLFCKGQIDGSQLNKKLLEHDIKILVDSVRHSVNLPPLFNDSILYVAAEHHAGYLSKKGSLSHFEPESKTLNSPQDRATYFGAPGSYLVGENVAYTYYNKIVKNKDRSFNTDNYNEIARSIVHAWVNSKGHYKNIISPDYDVTGLSISIDTKLKRIYACQKFANILYSYSFQENKSFFPYSQISMNEVNTIRIKGYPTVSYPYGLKFNEKEACNECKENWEYYPNMSVRVSHNYFILRVEQSDFVKDLIQNRKDGFAIELVPFDAFACGNPAYENEPSRRNEMKRTSGRLLEPVFRKDLMKGFKKRKKKKDISFVNYLFKADSVSFFKRFNRYKLINFDAKYFEIKLGKVPKDMEMWWNHNLVYIHKNQICHFVYLTNYPGEIDLEMIEVPYYPPIPVNQYDFVLDHYRDTIELYYNPGETVATGNELKAKLNKYKKEIVSVYDVQINGYCSVEGDADLNERLHKLRAEKILIELRTLMHSDSLCSIQSEVAWDHFYSAIASDPKWKFLLPYSRQEIIQYLTDPKNERPLKILEKERKTVVVISGVRELSPRNANYYISRDLNNMFVKDRQGKLTCINTDSLRRLYEKAYYFVGVDTLTKNEFLNIRIPKFVGSMPHELEHDLAFYRYHLLKDSVSNAELAKLESKIEAVFTMCGAPEHLTSQFHYLSACLLVDKIEKKGKNNTTDNPDIVKAFDRLNLLLQWNELDSTFLFDVAKANLNIINVLCETIDPDLVFENKDIINKSLIHIIEYYRKTNQLNSSSVVKLAKLLCYFQNYSLAIDICEEFLDDNEVLKLYLPLSYTHSSYLSSKNDLEFEAYFHGLLIEAKSRLTGDEWCSLFYGKLGIPFQVMDNKILHDEFCSSCPNRVKEVLLTD